MKDVSVEFRGTTLVKQSNTSVGRTRVARELAALQTLLGSPYVPRILGHEKGALEFSVVMEFAQGQSAEDWLMIDADWRGVAVRWSDAKVRLRQYALVEVDLLQRGAQYRDLNLEHLIFQEDKAILIDHEETIIGDSAASGRWQMNSIRGTWETMAPEEFSGHGILTTRTATYRMAVVAHLALTGSLPFPRMLSRADTYRWRKRHQPEVNASFSKLTQRVFTAALARNPVHRHRDPINFLSALEASINLDA